MEWFFEDEDDWWLYNHQTSYHLEEAYKLGQPTCQLLITGHLYFIDFSRMIYYRSSDPRKARKIKRNDFPSLVTREIDKLRSFDESPDVPCISYINEPNAPPLPSSTSPPPFSPSLPSPPPPPPPPSPALPYASFSSLSISSNGPKTHHKLFNSPTSRLSPSFNRPPSPSSLIELMSRLSSKLSDEASLQR